MAPAVVGLEIGPIAAAVTADDPAILDAVRSRYAGFVSSQPTGWRLRLSRRREGLVPLVDVTARRDGERVVLERHDFLATVDPARRAATVALGAVDDIAIDAALRVTWSLALIETRALLVHAASLVRAGAGYVFSGPSGAGKTTITRLSPHAVLLGDELAILQVDGRAGASCYGTPFWGELARAGENLSAPLRGLYFPVQADRHAARRLAAGEAVAALLPNVVFFDTDASLRARAFGVAADLCESTPAWELSFRRDAGFWDVVLHG